MTYNPDTDPDQKRIRSAGRPPYDLVLRGGRVLDPSTETDAPLDVAFAHGRVAAVAPHIAAEDAIQALDVSGTIVAPGLIDFHLHAYPGVSPLSLPADEYSLFTGVTTAVSAGDAGAATFEGFVRYVIPTVRTRLYAFCNICRTGLSSYPVGELRDLDLLDVEAAAATVLRYRDLCLGVKVRMTSFIVGSNGLEPLRRAIRAAEIANCPVMVHIYDIPGTLPDLLALLRPGDIVTHVYMGTSNGILDARGRIDPSVLDARSRGILFDVGHGSKAGFAFAVARAAIEQGFFPDTISTDLHTQSVNGSMRSLPHVMSKHLAMGMPFLEVLKRVTTFPAGIIDREPQLGTLSVGAPGDAVVLRLSEAEHDFFDDLGTGQARGRAILLVHTISAGRVVGAPYRHPHV
ncbi:MAG: amidohydrolase/deacetylase family metallohydrolase [Chloroflexi bacterium]|nr:amidohydrolase/deacetylase family metallohydrolase [Chloroflexota bacterium]